MIKLKSLFFILVILCSLPSMGHCDITWASPVAISATGVDASSAVVVIDSDNNATAIWVQDNTITASHLPSAGSWSSPVSLSNPSNTSTSPRLKIDGTGNVTALWEENGVIKSAVLPSGGSWGSAVSVSQSGASSPSLAVDSTGRAVAVWIRGGFVEASERISGSWSVSVAILSTTTSTNAHVAISDVGIAMAAWHTVSVSGTDLIQTSSSTLNGLNTNTWGTVKNVFSGTAAFSHNYPKIALDSSGNANVAWFRYNLVNSVAYENVQVFVSSLTFGGASWAIPSILSNAGIRNPADLTIKNRFDVNGNALVTWTQSYDGFLFTIESAKRLFGSTTWTTVTAHGSNLYSFGMDVDVTGGTALLTNMAWDETSTILIQSEELDVTNPTNFNWTNSNTLSTEDDNGYPQSALAVTDTTLYGVTVWSRYDGANTLIYASSGSASVVIPPENVSAVQENTIFGVYTDYYNTISWDASTDPNLVSYNIYRNGVFFAEVLANTLEFVDHNQTQNGTVEYGVAAMTSESRQSAIATFTINP